MKRRNVSNLISPPIRRASRGFWGARAALFAIAAVASMLDANFEYSCMGIEFVVQGNVEHEQFGGHPMKTRYVFTARSGECAWSITSAEASRRVFDEIVAVGSEKGVFITMVLAGAVGLKGPNTAQVVAFTNIVPNSTFTPQLSPIWLTYLSACEFKGAQSKRVPPPMVLNTAGGSPLPPFSDYQQLSYWRRNEQSGLPDEFISIDDSGFLMGIVRDELVPAAKLPLPFASGFTNITFRVHEYAEFHGVRLPRVAVMDVHWVREGKLELVHRISIRGEEFHDPPSAPIPQPSPMGIALVSDARADVAGRTIVVEYLATNRFLDPAELSQLPEFKEAVRRSLSKQTHHVQSGKPRAYIVALIIISTLVFVTLCFRHRNLNKPGKERHT